MNFELILEPEKRWNLFPSTKSAKLSHHLLVIDNYFFIFFVVAKTNLHLVEKVKSFFFNLKKFPEITSTFAKLFSRAVVETDSFETKTEIETAKFFRDQDRNRSWSQFWLRDRQSSRPRPRLVRMSRDQDRDHKKLVLRSVLVYSPAIFHKQLSFANILVDFQALEQFVVSLYFYILSTHAKSMLLEEFCLLKEKEP